tara:strand:+ start:131 stop:526 length:396 start_codon:yes stop_codon:yes gene_type:complete
MRSRASKALTTPSSRAMGGGGATPPMPPFARNLAPTQKLPEDHELIWDDGVAPELTIDFDAQHVGKWEGLAWWLGGFGFFASVFGVAALTDPVGKNPAVNREEAGHIVGSLRVATESVGSSDDEEEEDDDE